MTFCYVKATLKSAAVLLAVVLPALDGRSEEKLSRLATPYEAFTNVVITQVTATQLFFQDAEGLRSVKLSDLDPDLQKRFGYDPSVAAAADVVPANNRDGLRAAVANLAGLATSAELTNTNATEEIPPGRHAKNFPLGDAGTLKLVIPNLWEESFQPPPTNSSPSAILRFKRPYDEDLLVQLTTVPTEEKLLKSGARQVMATIGARALAGAKEEHLDLKEIGGSDVHGYYFTLTDKKLADVSEPKPGSYKYQTQGLVMVNGIGLDFAIFYNFPSTCDPVAALEMIRTATLSAPDRSEALAAH